MKPINISEVKNIAEYEKIRPEFRARIIELKNNRRISVGPKITFVFENRDTVLSQIQEMMRAERIVHEEKIQDEINVYNQLLPGSNELSATMFIEITTAGKIKEELEELLGITRSDCVAIQIGDQYRVPAIFEEGHEEDDKLAAVQYVRFKFSEEAKDAFLSKSSRIVINHPNYQASAEILDNVRDNLRSDLSDTSQ
ncbi:MAG TPA: DUF3501 family protein [Blastocatellia bacterium]|nr:DUF3501 family protein [Blastocatellia bacterium]